MPLALLPSSNVLLETPPEVLQKQLDLIPGQPGSKPVQAVCTSCVGTDTVKATAAASIALYTDLACVGALAQPPELHLCPFMLTR